MGVSVPLLLTAMASMVPGRSVAMGFSQKMCLPAAAHFLIWSAWNCEGEQIHTCESQGEKKKKQV